MKTIMLRGSTTELTLDEMWHRVSDVQAYPQRIKYCRKVWDVDFREGGGYTDTTTLLWWPIKIRHHIAKVQYPTQIVYDLHHQDPGWTSTQTFTFSAEGDRTMLQAEVTYHFDNPIFDRTFGLILRPRLVQMLRSAFPEIPGERVL
jgi:ribosome-associated toxin RatA of RatAB toxin-antitoxin module